MGSRACSASTNAAIPPCFCASAMTCSATVVLPLDSGPKISTTRPRGKPPTPRAASKEMEPVEITAMGTMASLLPSRIIEPLPNCFSIWASARSIAFAFSNLSSANVSLPCDCGLYYNRAKKKRTRFLGESCCENAALIRKEKLPLTSLKNLAPGPKGERPGSKSGGRGLPVGERHVVQPNGIGVLGIVAVHLKGDINFTTTPGLGPIGPVKVVLHTIESEGDEDRLVVVSGELPCYVVPDEGRRRRAGNVSMPPSAAGCVPDVPDATISDVALRAKYEFGVAGGLVDIKFQRLRKLRGSDIEIQVILEICNTVVAPELLPPEHVRICRRAPDVELGGTATKGGRCLELEHREAGWGAVTPRTCARRTIFPATHVLNLALDDGIGGH